MSGNFFESHALAKRAMKDNLFTEVYLSTAVTTPIQLKGWVTQANPYESQAALASLHLARRDPETVSARRAAANVSG